MTTEPIEPEEYERYIRTMIPDQILMWMINNQNNTAFRLAKAKMPSATHYWLLGELIDEAYRRELIDAADHDARLRAEGF